MMQPIPPTIRGSIFSILVGVTFITIELIRYQPLDWFHAGLVTIGAFIVAVAVRDLIIIWWER